jgi:hypothetical protein
MSAIRTLIQLSSIVLLTLLALTARAEQKLSDGRYEIHYNAFNSSFITPEVAQQYNITRSQYRALINVSVLRIEQDGSKTPVRAQVRGEAANLIDQAQQLEFRQIDEGNALYYLASFRFTNDEQLTISLQVQPDANADPYRIEFQQTFYID